MDMKKLLAATAVAALIAGPNLAVAQSTTTSSPTGASKSGPSPSAASPSAASPSGAARDDAGTPAPGDKVPQQRTGQNDINKGQGPGAAQKNAQKGEAGHAGSKQASDRNKDGDDARKGGSRHADDSRKGAGDAHKGDAGKNTQRGDADNSSDLKKGGQRAGSRANDDEKATTGVGGSGSLTAEKRTQIKQTIIKSGNAPRVSNVNFSVSVGTTVPRSVTLVAVPATVVEIYPAWGGYEYFIVGGQIVIVDPGTMRIVAVLPA